MTVTLTDEGHCFLLEIEVEGTPGVLKKKFGFHRAKDARLRCGQMVSLT